MANPYLHRPTLRGRPRRAWRQVGNTLVEITDQILSFADVIDRSTWPKLLEITGQILITEQASEARLTDAAASGAEYVSFSAVGDSCALCQELDGRIFLASSPEAKRFSPPLHINCDCIWIEVGPEEIVRPEDVVGADYVAGIADLVDQHGTWLGEEIKYEALRCPSGPNGRDWTFRRIKDPQTGELVSQLEWRRPRYELPGLADSVEQTGVTAVGERAGVVTGLGG